MASNSNRGHSSGQFNGGKGKTNPTHGAARIRLAGKNIHSTNRNTQHANKGGHGRRDPGRH